MVIESSYDELKRVQTAIDNFKATEPSTYQKFINIINLTRQLQFDYQYMGSLLTEEDASSYQPITNTNYVLSVYRSEIEKLKIDNKFIDLKQLLNKYKKVSYSNISKLALGENPKALVGPTVIRS
jgi:hypothetical protein